MRFELIVFVFLIGASRASSPNSLASKWSTLEIAIRSRFSTAFDQTLADNLASFLNQTFERTISSSCKNSLIDLVNSLRAMDLWAVKMFDASAKLPPSGLFEGTVTDLGQYDECLSVRMPARYVGQYCTLRIEPFMPERPLFNTIYDKIPQLAEIIENADGNHSQWLTHFASNAHYFYFTPIRLGICMPSACSAGELNQLIGRWFNKNFALNAKIADDGCETEEQVNLTKQLGRKQWVSIGILSAFCLLVSLGTLADAFDLNARYFSLLVLLKWLIKHSSFGEHSAEEVKKEAEQVEKLSDHRLFGWLNCFSVKRNLPILVDVQRRSDETGKPFSIDVIHGLKVFAMLWVILAHTYGLINPQNHEKIFVSTRMYSDLLSQPLLNGTLSVNTFFAISGLLTSFNLLMGCGKARKNLTFFIMAVVLRLFRLLPPYIGLICVTLLFAQFRAGPLWSEAVQRPVIENCEASYWTNLIFLNNFIKTRQMCLMHTWYLSIDMQFYVFGLALFYLFLRNKRLTQLLMLASAAVATIYCLVVTYLHNYPPTILAIAPAVTERWHYILDFYYKPYGHLSSYLLGFYFGYALCLLQTGEEKSWLYQLYSGAISRTATNLSMASLCLLTLFSIWPWNAGLPVPPLVTAIYASTFRFGWSLSVLWFIYSLTIQRSGSVYHFLSHPIWHPLSRLTYSTFLFHPIIIWLHFGTVEHRLSYTHLEFARMFASNVVLSVILAMISCLLFESPIVNLQKLIFKDLRKLSTAESGRPAADAPNELSVRA